MTCNMATVWTFSSALIFLAVTIERAERGVWNLVATEPLQTWRRLEHSTNLRQTQSILTKIYFLRHKKKIKMLGSDTLTVLSAGGEMWSAGKTLYAFCLEPDVLMCCVCLCQRNQKVDLVDSINWPFFLITGEYLLRGTGWILTPWSRVLEKLTGFQYDSVHSVVLVTILFFYYHQTQQGVQSININ
jgi:hypothetical protein